jgi:RHS repeat-associated protein
VETNDYYPFGLTMAGISSKALNFGEPENKKGFNGIEHTTDLDLNQYDAFYRTLDPQIGRFLQIDPKIESAEAWSPYSAMLDNPIRYADPLGDSTVPGMGFWYNFGGGLRDGWESTKSFAKSLTTKEGWQNFGNSIADMGDRLNPSSPSGIAKNVETAVNTIQAVKNIPNMTGDDVGHALGFGTEKVAEAVVLTKGVGAVSKALGGAEAAGISNPIPGEVSRVVPNTGDITTLGRPGSTEAFVTASSDIKGMNATQIANRLTIPESSTGYKVITFKTPYGIATPINRDIPGFVGGGRTAGGAREFVVPNQAIPKGAKIKVVE